MKIIQKNIRFEKEDYIKLQQLAEDKYMSVSTYIRAIVLKQLKEEWKNYKR